MSKYDVQNLKVVLGDHNLKLTGETRGTIAEHGVKRVIRHKRFDSTSLVSAYACDETSAHAHMSFLICSGMTWPS